ncbi:MAG: toxin-antitoxin system antidote component [Algoriphagus marincola HL-49]|uniref:Toxin-antitoxin system antidote component n=1 Tax=Algoriphagus marincola HL-49 TaxID=1305737 RepID=A0A0P8C7T0_9BACT|nr:MAG: toxin-antitoxin system antidote component [Algoriphagus marincola HL-49]
MNTKLTLTLEKDVIEKAKEYAAQQGQSLSSLVENYFKLLVLEKKEDSVKKERKPLPESFLKLEGCLKHEGEFDYKEELTKALMEKYGL